MPHNVGREIASPATGNERRALQPGIGGNAGNIFIDRLRELLAGILRRDSGNQKRRQRTP